ncbi:hypothetical protein ACFYKX_25200 [Cytobacillus sp. FJAT-54145]|uniref:Uncharacterized protein n=1 Tax=Cytobacillus spartinae TaxID=3299023 RepID=A0ABW6KHZ8_9BACI
MFNQLLKRMVSLFMITILLFWSFFPAISYAGEFIKPGTAITPGKSFSPGTPITGGTFIIPGEVYSPGKAYAPGQAYTPGKVSLVSGQPILPGSPLQLGLFMIPNAPPSPPGFLLWELEGLKTGPAMQVGDPLKGGESSAGGNESEGGEALTGGKGSEGGEALTGGNGSEGGETLTGGKGSESGEALTGGKGSESGETLTGGKGAEGGDTLTGGKGSETGEAVNGGNNAESGDSLKGGDSSSGGDTIEGNTTEVGNISGDGNTPIGGSPGSDEVPPWYNVIFKSTDGSKGIAGHISGAISDFKTFGLGFLNKNVSGGFLSMLAGFKYEQIGNSTNYKIFGKNKFDNKLLDNLYQKYKNYTFEGAEKNLGPNSRRISEARLNAFLESKKLKVTDKGFFKHVGNSVKTAINNSWNPFSKEFIKPKNWLKPTKWFNKDFFAKSNVMKLSGPVGYLTTAFSSVYDYNWGDNQHIGWKSSDFAAALTTDVAIGVVSTGISSVASSMAVGAVAGSAVPGLGTIVGAVAGLGAGLITTYLINGTGRGRRMKKAITSTIKKGYDWVGGGLKKLGGLFG